MPEHADVHECDHDDCFCFWCKVSRRWVFETITDVMSTGKVREDHG